MQTFSSSENDPFSLLRRLISKRLAQQKVGFGEFLLRETLDLVQSCGILFYFV